MASKSCMTHLFFTFNLIFLLSGVALITIGCIIRASNSDFYQIVQTGNITAPTLLIIIGCFVFFISFFGCCGVLRENPCMITTFSLLMSAVIIAEVAIGVVGVVDYTLQDKTEDMLTKALNSSMENYSKSEEYTDFWDQLQGHFSCCGTTSYTDWMPILHKLPLSCCTPTQGTKGVMTCDALSKDLYKTPCAKALETVVIDNFQYIGITGIGIALFQLVGVIYSCYLASSIRNDYETV